MSPTLRKHQLNWEDGYFDRRLRPNDSVGSVLRYMLLNPYRKHLQSADREWPFWYCNEEAKPWISIAEEKNDTFITLKMMIEARSFRSPLYTHQHQIP